MKELIPKDKYGVFADNHDTARVDSLFVAEFLKGNTKMCCVILLKFEVIRETDAPDVLVEGGFVDNKSDADYIKSNYKKLAKAYADGIAKTLNVSKKTASESVQPSTKECSFNQFATISCADVNLNCLKIMRLYSILNIVAEY